MRKENKNGEKYQQGKLTIKDSKNRKSNQQNREQYDRLTVELEELHKKQKAIQNEELLKVIETSSRSYEEILNFIQGKNEEE